MVFKRSFAKLKSSKVAATPASSISSRGLKGFGTDELRTSLEPPFELQGDECASRNEPCRARKASGANNLRRRAVAWAQDFYTPLHSSIQLAGSAVNDSLDRDRGGLASGVDNDYYCGSSVSSDVISRHRGRLTTTDRPLAVEDLSALLSLENLCSSRFSHYQPATCFDQHSSDGLSPQELRSGGVGSPSFSHYGGRRAHASVHPETPTESLAASSDLRDYSVMSSDLGSFNDDIGSGAGTSDEGESIRAGPKRGRSNRDCSRHDRSHGRGLFTRPTRQRYQHGVPSVLFAEVYETELQLSSQTQQRTTNLTLGCGSPAQGTRQRIRCRVSFPLDPSEYSNLMAEDTGDEKFIDGLLADGNVISEDEVDHIRKTIWYPEGKNVPPPYLIRLGYHTAWDIGKRGCIALKLRTVWESSTNPNRLRFFLMDGTDPYSFLSIYSKNDLLSESTGVNGHSYRKKTVLAAQEVRNGIWDYEAGRVVVRCYRRGGHTKMVIIDRLPRHFTEAILVCIREMAVHQEIDYLRTQRLRAARLEEYRRLLDRRQTLGRGTVAMGAALEAAREAGSNRSFFSCSGKKRTSNTSIENVRQLEGIGDFRSETRRREIGSIGPARKPAKGVVTPSQSVVASLVAAAAHRPRSRNTVSVIESTNNSSTSTDNGSTTVTASSNAAEAVNQISENHNHPPPPPPAIISSCCCCCHNNKTTRNSISGNNRCPSCNKGNEGSNEVQSRKHFDAKSGFTNNSVKYVRCENTASLEPHNRPCKNRSSYKCRPRRAVTTSTFDATYLSLEGGDCRDQQYSGERIVVRGPRKGTRSNRRTNSRCSRASSTKSSTKRRTHSRSSNRSRSWSIHRSSSAIAYLKC